MRAVGDAGRHKHVRCTRIKATNLCTRQVFAKQRTEGGSVAELQCFMQFLTDSILRDAVLYFI